MLLRAVANPSTIKNTQVNSLGSVRVRRHIVSGKAIRRCVIRAQFARAIIRNIARAAAQSWAMTLPRRISPGAQAMMPRRCTERMFCSRRMRGTGRCSGTSHDAEDGRATIWM
jgi:hypothetical protein